MASSAFSAKKQPAIATQKSNLIGGIGFDRVMIVLACWFTIGTFIDGWAHSHHLVDKTFFTPWHAILYSGYFAQAIVLIATVVINHSRGSTWLRAIPAGYELSLLGVPLFTLAGVGDLLWHTLFGFEVGVEPLLSPTHLLLALSGILMGSGPLRAIWQRSADEAGAGWAMLFPALVSLTLVFSAFTFFTAYNNPISHTELVTAGLTDATKSRGVASILFNAALQMGILLYAIRRWQLPLGTFTLILTTNVALMSVFHDAYRLIPAAFLAGIIADLLYWRLKPSTEQIDRLRIFAFVVPVVFYLLYFATLDITERITWSIHLWLGSSILTGVVGLLLSYLMIPPSVPAKKAAG